jgi:hypothetical protein
MYVFIFGAVHQDMDSWRAVCARLCMLDASYIIGRFRLLNLQRLSNLMFLFSPSIGSQPMEVCFTFLPLTADGIFSTNRVAKSNPRKAPYTAKLTGEIEQAANHIILPTYLYLKPRDLIHGLSVEVVKSPEAFCRIF